MAGGFSVIPTSLRRSGEEMATVGGNAIKRVDLTGRSHGGVPTPHVVTYRIERHPQTGQVFIKENQGSVRPATPQEMP